MSKGRICISLLILALLFPGWTGAEELKAPRSYPGQVVFDERGKRSVSIRVNAQTTRLADIARGSRVQSGEPLVWFKSAELRTVQKSYLSTYRNASFQDLSYQSESVMARNRLTLLWRGLSREEVQQLEMEAEPLEEIALEAPMDGIVLGLEVFPKEVVNAGVQVGQFTAVGTPALRLGDPSRLLVEARLPLRDARRLAANDPVHIRGLGDRPIEGEVVAVYPATQETTSRRRVLVAPTRENGSSRLVPGAQVSVAVSLRSRPVSRWEQRRAPGIPTGEPKTEEVVPLDQNGAPRSGNRAGSPGSASPAGARP
jgi:hypothetical protein